MKYVLALVLLFVSSLAHAATCTVTTVADSVSSPAATSLRGCLASVANGDTIAFAGSLGGKTISLQGQLVIDKSITIDASAPSSPVTLSGRSVNRVVSVPAGSTVTLRGLTIAYGAATIGGGILNAGNLTLDRVTVRDCAATGAANVAFGGGVCNESTGTLVVNESTIIDNLSGFMGGGIGAVDGGTITVRRSLIAQNASLNAGGGIGMRATGVNGITTLEYSTIAYNVSGLEAGAGNGVASFRYNSAAAQLMLRNCTVANNKGGGGLGIASLGHMTLANTIAYGNDVIDVYNEGGTTTSLGSNIIGTRYQFDQVASDRIGVNPYLAPLGSYGGPTQTFALLPGSPAINLGTDIELTKDQRGVSLVGAPDSGAFESRGFTFTLSGNNQRTLVWTQFAEPLVIKVNAVASGEPVAGGRIGFHPPTTGARLTLGEGMYTLDAVGETRLTVTANNVAGAYMVAVSANGAPGTSFSLTNLNPVAISTASLPSATAGSQYDMTLAASGGTAPYSYVVSNGALPAGLSLALDGTLSGTPMVAGDFALTVRATDSSSNAGPYDATRTYTLSVDCPDIAVSSPTDAVVGALYAVNLFAEPAAAYTWDVVAGALPDGLSLVADGRLSGTPTARGTSQFTLRATGFGTCEGTRDVTLVVGCPQCDIDGACVAAGALDPDNACRVCDPFVSTTSYSDRALGLGCPDDDDPTTADYCDGAGECVHVDLGICVIDGTTYAAGVLNPDNACEACDPRVSVVAFTPLGAGLACDDDGLFCTRDVCDGQGVCTHTVEAACLIDGECVAPGETAPDNDCLECNPFVSTTAHTARPRGVTCQDDGLAHTSDTCDGNGACTHAALGTCVIDGVSYVGGTAHPSEVCLACDPTVDPTDWSPRAQGFPCASDDDACTMDVCDGGGACEHISTCADPSGPDEPGKKPGGQVAKKSGCAAVDVGPAMGLIALLLLRRKRGLPQVQ